MVAGSFYLLSQLNAQGSIATAGQEPAVDSDLHAGVSESAAGAEQVQPPTETAAFVGMSRPRFPGCGVPVKLTGQPTANAVGPLCFRCKR